MLQRRKEGFTFEIGTSQNNYYRNRYKDVLPYDQTRVILKSGSDSDYINANYINVISRIVLNKRNYFNSFPFLDAHHIHGYCQSLHCNTGTIANDM